MKIANVRKQVRTEGGIDGESTVKVPHWDFDVDGEAYHATPHYSGFRLIVGKKGPDGRFYTISKDGADLGALEWSKDGSHTRCSLPHTVASRWLTQVNYTDDNQLWGMLEAAL